MIAVTRLNRVEVLLNSDLIEFIEMTPDTVITLTTGQKIMVLEPASEVVDRVVRFRRSIMNGALLQPVPRDTAGIPWRDGT